jgi:hypothetical protein
MTLLALGSTYFLYGYTVKFAIFHILMKFFIDAVKAIVGKLHLGFAVAIYTPTHAEVAVLVNLTHFLNFTMTGLAGNFSGLYVL